MSVRSWDPYQAHSLRSGEPLAPAVKALPPPVQVVDGVPVGTTVQIQHWVGSDPERAQLAWTRERKQERPRITLLTSLESVLKQHGISLAPLEPVPLAIERDPDPWQQGPLPVEQGPLPWREDPEKDGERGVLL